MLVLAALLAAAAPTPGCIDVRSGEAPVSFEGRLQQASFSMRETTGGQPERTYILTIAPPICIDDGGDFADPHRRFTQIQLYTSQDRLWPGIRAAVGHRVRVQGTGFAAQTAHHHAPLVVDVRSVSRAGR